MVLAAEAPRSPVDLAIPALHLGDTERALRLMEEAGRRKFGWGLAFLAVDPRFDPLRAEPRFQRLLDQLGLGGVASPRVTPAAAPPATAAPASRLRARS